MLFLKNGKHGQGTHSTKMGADKLIKNTQNATKHIWPNCLLKIKNLKFRRKKGSLGVSSTFKHTSVLPKSCLVFKSSSLKFQFKVDMETTLRSSYSIFFCVFVDTIYVINTYLKHIGSEWKKKVYRIMVWFPV